MSPRPQTQARPNANAAHLDSTADYHHSLLDQKRHHEPCRSSRGQAAPTTTKTNVFHNPDTSGKAARKTSSGKKDLRQATPPPSRRELEEFDALPIAIRRKYFSTLERLRLAAGSGILNGIFHDSCNTNDKINDKVPSKAEPQGGTQGRVVPGKLTGRSSSPQLYRGQAEMPTDCFAIQHSLTPKLKQNHLTREQQVILARQMRESVILDAADEAIHKFGRRASRHLSSNVYTTTLSSTRPSMESPTSGARPSQTENTRDSLYDTFRWLDEDEDLDLRLLLDDYHTNLRDALPLPAKEFRPSFRRHLSITKSPFGRSSTSSSRPATKHGVSTPTSPKSSATYLQHGRRKSRALSLITPKHAAQDSLASIDPAAAHYQDPEARMKLRVFLASPQKFDEAIEFGFPSNDFLSAGTRPELNQSRQHRAGRVLSGDSEKFKTFLSDENDETSSTYSDEAASLPDPESPRTPRTPDKQAMKLPPFPADDSNYLPKVSENYAQGPSASREMTLRLTLTRPDLRACEDHIYGRQRGQQQQQTRQFSQPEDLVPPNAVYNGDVKSKECLEDFFASLDETDSSQPTDGSVMKRLKNLFHTRH